MPPGFSQTGQKLVGLCTTCFHGHSILIGQSCRCGQYFCAAVCRPSAVISDIAGQHVADEWTMQTMPVRGWGWCFAFLPFLPQSMLNYYRGQMRRLVIRPAYGAVQMPTLDETRAAVRKGRVRAVVPWHQYQSYQMVSCGPGTPPRTPSPPPKAHPLAAFRPGFLQRVCNKTATRLQRDCNESEGIRLTRSATSPYY